jgi:Fe-S cluster assembly protein SufD
MSVVLPTNRDENWRYANLRPLAKARRDAVAAQTTPPPVALPAALPGYERWVFIDGQFAATLSTPAAHSCAALLDVGDAGEAFAQLLDSAIASEGVDFALARINAAGGSKVLQLTVPDGAQTRIELVFVASAAASAGTSYPRVQVHAGKNAQLRIVERHLSAGSADSAINAAFDLALRADSTLDHCRLQNLSDSASCFDTLTAHVGDRASYRLPNRNAGRADFPFHHPGEARGSRRALRIHGRQHCQRHSDARHLRGDRTRGRGCGDA